MKIQILSRSFLILVVCGSLMSCHHKPDDPSVVRSHKYKKSLKEAYNNLGLFYQANFIPGMTFAVSIDNQLVLADGFGYSNYELKVKASPVHKFRIGQVSELITALTVAKLQEEGKLQLDKPVTEYLSEINKKSIDFTLRQLGAHVAGIRQEEIPAGTDPNNSLEKLIPSFINDNLNYEPGTFFSHTELGFDLIAHIIEKTTGKNFSKVVKKIVLDTLKLTATTPDIPFRITANRSSNYDYDFMAQPRVANQIDLRGKEASAGYLSSVLDLIKIGNTLLYPGFLKQETIQWMTMPYKLKNGQNGQYSFGLIAMKDLKNRTFYGERGTVTGGSATLLIYPDDKLVIAMASNVENSSWEFPVFEIAEIFMAQLHPELYPKKDEQEEAPANNQEPASTPNSGEK